MFLLNLKMTAGGHITYSHMRIVGKTKVNILKPVYVLTVNSVLAIQQFPATYPLILQKAY